MATVTQEQRGAMRTKGSTHGLAAIGLTGFWLAVAAAETLLGDGQDALDDVAMISRSSSLITGAGLLHWLAGVLLVVALVGLAPLVWPSRVGRAGWWLSLTMTTSLGAFAMLHLLAVETAAPGLDPVGMNEFLVDRLGAGAGPWIGPMLLVGLLGPVSVLVLLCGVVRVGLSSWLAPALFGAGAVVHMAVPGEVVETGSHWLMAAGTIVAGHRTWRARRDGREAAAPQRSFPHARAAVLGLGTFWFVFAIGEVLTLGGQDALDDVGMISDNYGVITTAGYAYWLAGVLLVVGLAGVLPVAWGTTTGRIGLGLSALVATALGAFSMLHLFAIETAAHGLSTSAMNDFLVQRVGAEAGTGPWVLPILTVGLFGPVALAVLLAGLARAGLMTYLPCGVFVVGGALRFATIPAWLEIGSYVVLAAVLLHAAVQVGRAMVSGR